MVKRQKEKQYQSAREHRATQKEHSLHPSSSSVCRPLPFHCCALTLTPFVTPVCSPDGILFENSAIVPYVLQHKVDPVTGRPLSTRDLIVLHMDRDVSSGCWMCPVLHKNFNDRTKIVAICQRPETSAGRVQSGTEANVYSYEAYLELNVKAKNYTDLQSGLPFDKQRDVIVIQDPENQQLCNLRDIANFHHLHTLRQKAASATKESLGSATEPSATSSLSGDVRYSVTASRIMEKLEREKRKRQQEEIEQVAKQSRQKSADDIALTESLSSTIASKAYSMEESLANMTIYTDELLTSLNLTSGRASGSFTSTSMNISSQNQVREATREEIISSQCEHLKKLKKKGIVQIHTNLGSMDVELMCDIAPRTAMNFLLLAEKGEYNGSRFHRSIPNFMIQGGKKSKAKKKNLSSNSTKEEGGSYWEVPFCDEFDDRLTHTGPGILSMANSGPNTNGRQFFITFKSCPHLNRKHSIFGKVLSGLEVLQKMEQVPTDKNTDQPLERIVIETIDVLENPVIEALQLERQRVLKRKEEKRLLNQSRKLGGESILGRSQSENALKSVVAPPKMSLEDVPSSTATMEVGK